MAHLWEEEGRQRLKTVRAAESVGTLKAVIYRYNAATDVYSFGMLLWELMTHRLPYERFDEHLGSFEECVINGYREVIPDNAPAVFREMTEGCWHSDPKKRLPLAKVIEELKAGPEEEIEKMIGTSHRGKEGRTIEELADHQLCSSQRIQEMPILAFEEENTDSTLLREDELQQEENTSYMEHLRASNRSPFSFFRHMSQAQTRNHVQSDEIDSLEANTPQIMRS